MGCRREILIPWPPNPPPLSPLPPSLSLLRMATTSVRAPLAQLTQLAHARDPPTQARRSTASSPTATRQCCVWTGAAWCCRPTGASTGSPPLPGAATRCGLRSWAHSWRSPARRLSRSTRWPPARWLSLTACTWKPPAPLPTREPVRAHIGDGRGGKEWYRSGRSGAKRGAMSLVGRCWLIAPHVPPSPRGVHYLN